MKTGMWPAGLSTVRSFAALGVEWTSGQGSAVTGTCYWLPEGGVVFLGQLAPSASSVPVAADELVRRSSPPGSVPRLIAFRVLRPGVS